MSAVKFKFGDFCRLCLKQADDLIYIKSSDTDSVTFLDKLGYLNENFIQNADILPNWLCVRCKKQLCFAYKFAKKCQKSKSILTECLDQIKLNHYGDMGKQFLITNIKNVQRNSSVVEDPLNIKEEDIQDLDEDTSVNFDHLSIPIKQEPEEITIEENDIEEEEITMEEVPQEYNSSFVKLEPLFEQETLENKDSLDLLVPTEDIRGNEKQRNVYLTCSICFKAFTNEEELSKHIEYHDNIYSCALCGKSFKLKENLSRHLQTHLTDEEKYYFCKFCDKKYTNARTWRHHMTTHHNKKKGKLVSLDNANKFACNICNNNFQNKRLLVAHVRRHFD